MISDAEFRLWLKQDNRADRVWTAHLSYQIEDSAGEPATALVRLSDKPYRRGAGRYYAVLQSVPEFYRELGGDRHGVYSSSYGALVLDARGGEFDWLLSAAIDGSTVEFRHGDVAWDIADHRLMYVARMVNVDRANVEALQIQIQDTGVLLNKRIAGQTLIGGTGPNADKPRSFNFGRVRQLECFLVDFDALRWSHSDTGVNTVAYDIQVRLESVGFTDDGDGTFRLDAPPPTTGIVTADVIATPPDADPLDQTRHLVSDMLDVAVGIRSGLADAGLYFGPHATFTIGDFEDYPVGVNVAETENTFDFLADATKSGQFSWAITRLGLFTYLRIRPNDIASLPMTPFDIGKDDIFFDDGIEISNAPPGYYRIRAYCDKNWKLTDDIAGDVLDSEQYASKTRAGLYGEQLDAVGDTYADRPELYDLTLVESPIIDTWISGDGDDTEDGDILTSWMEVERFNGLPWLQTVQLSVGLEFYEKELGDVCNLTIDRFGLNAGGLFQVIGIRLKVGDVSDKLPPRLQLTLFRRNLSEAYPIGWSRHTASVDATVESSFILDSRAGPPVVPPPTPIPIPIGITPIGGLGLSWSSTTPTTPPVTRSDYYLWLIGFQGQVVSFLDFNRSVATDSTGTLWPVGVSNDATHVGSGEPGHIDVYERSGDAFTKIATLSHSDVGTAMLGYTVSIADEGTIISSQFQGGRHHVFTQTAPTTWSHALLRDSGQTLSGANAAIARTTGNVVVLIDDYGDQAFYIYKRTAGVWSLQQTINIAPDAAWTADISADGKMIAVSCNDVLGNLTARVYASDPTLTTWTLTNNLTPTSENGNTGDFDGQAISISSDKTLVLAVAPNDQTGTKGGTVFVYQNDGTGSFALQSWLRSSSAATSVGIGQVAVSDGPLTRVFASDTFYAGAGSGRGRAFWLDGAISLSPGPQYLDVRGTALFDPYTGGPNSQRFGEAVAVTTDANYLAIASGDNNDTGSNTIDFYKRITPLAAGLVLYADTMGGAAGDFSARTPDAGSAYTAEFGSLADMVVDGAGSMPSRDTSIGFDVTAASDLTQPPNYIYRIAITATVTAAGAGVTASLDVAARIAASDTWMVEWFMFWNGASGVWTLFPNVANSNGSSITPGSGINVTAYVTTGVEHIFTVDVDHDARTIVWKIDGTTVHADSVVPDAFPDSIILENSANPASASNINASDVRIVTL